MEGRLQGSMWALLGFGLAAVLCFAVPVAQTAVQDWVSHGGHTMIENASVMAGISIVWSVLRAGTYALLLIAVFAGALDLASRIYASVTWIRTRISLTNR